LRGANSTVPNPLAGFEGQHLSGEREGRDKRKGKEVTGREETLHGVNF